MESSITSKRVHPLVAGAAISVMLVSLTGVAAITGILPKSHGSAAPAAAAPVAATPTAAPVASVNTNAETTVKPAPTAQAPRPRPVRTSQSPQPAKTYAPAPVAQAAAVCYSCGRVESVQAIKQAAAPSGIGMVAGAVLGGVLGNQVGGGSGRKIATVAGAVGGGYAGNEVEKNSRASTTYQVRVRMEGGEVRSFPYPQQPAWSVGDRVRVVDGRLSARA